MFDFVRKPFLWQAWDTGLGIEIGRTEKFHLKSIQDLAVYAHLRGTRGKTVAEIGGGNSRLLRKLAEENACFNLEKFQGADGGPKGEITIAGVSNLHVFLGENSTLLKDQSFDIAFSVSVVEHIPTANLDAFFKDGLRILKPGGLWLHAIDLYVEDEPSSHVIDRFNIYRDWIRHPKMEPVGPVFEGPIKFTCDIATNPDDAMYEWGRIAPSLTALRQRAQSVSLLAAARKR